MFKALGTLFTLTVLNVIHLFILELLTISEIEWRLQFQQLQLKLLVVEIKF